MKKKLLSVVLTLALVFGIVGTLNFQETNAKTKEPEEVKATSITFKTSTGGDFVAGVCKMKITFRLSAAAKNVQLSIIDSDEEVVYTQTIKSVKKKKATTFQWDGRNKKKKYVAEDFYNVEIKVGETTTNSMELDVNNGSFKLIRKSGFAGGDGSSKKPYQVKNLEQLKNVEEHNGEYFKQVADIDIDYEDFKGMFSEENMFTGSYDGGDHSISNAILTEGLFHYIGEGGEVKNLNFVGINVDGHCAGVVASINSGTIKKCKVDTCNVAQGSYASGNGKLGAIAGINYSKITNCEVTDFTSMDSTSSTSVGGICGENMGNIILCKVKDSDLASTNYSAYYTGDVGGIAAYNTGNISNCTVTDITIEDKGDIGLFVGENDGVVTGCTPKSSDIGLVGCGNAAV